VLKEKDISKNQQTRKPSEDLYLYTMNNWWLV